MAHTGTHTHESVMATRSTRALADRYAASFADVAGDVNDWDGQQHVPVTRTIEVRKAGSRFEIVIVTTPRSTTTPRSAS